MTVLKQYNGSSWQPVAVGAQGLTGVQGTNGPQGIQGIQGTTPAGGSMTQIATGTFSGTSLTISSIPQIYKSLTFYYYGLSNNNGGSPLYLNFNNATGYMYGRGSNSSWTGNAATTEINIGVTDTGTNTMGSFSIDQYTQTGQKIVNGSSKYNWFWGTCYSDTTALTSLKVYDASGYTFNNGTYILYGVN